MKLNELTFDIDEKIISNDIKSKLKYFTIKNDIIEIEINNNKKEYNVKSKNFFSMLSHFCKKYNVNLYDILYNSLNTDDCKCEQCGKLIEKEKIYISRSKINVPKYCCNDCYQNHLNEYKEKQKIKLKTKKCKICGQEYICDDSRPRLGTCSNEKCKKIARERLNNKIKETHWTHKDNKNDINEKRINTRLKNDKEQNRQYTAWNKGKTGIYSKETIEKIRQATIKQLSEQRVHKTGIEKIIENLLKENNINYKYSFILENRQFDFCLLDYNIIIECDGDYWHGNPKFYPILTEQQKMKQKDDLIKTNIAKENNFFVFHFWEYDINNNLDNIKKQILNKIKDYEENIL